MGFEFKKMDGPYFLGSDARRYVFPPVVRAVVTCNISQKCTLTVVRTS